MHLVSEDSFFKAGKINFPNTICSYEFIMLFSEEKIVGSIERDTYAFLKDCSSIELEAPRNS
jgi:hypothetical protein